MGLESSWREKIAKAIEALRSHPFTDSLVTSALAAFPVLGTFLSNWYSRSAGSDSEKTNQILQVLTSLQQGSDEQFGRLSQQLANRSEEILAHLESQNIELVALISAAQDKTNAKLDELLVFAKLNAQVSALTVSELLDKGREFAKAGNQAQALEYYERAVTRDPANASAWREKSWALYRLDKIAQASESFDEAVKLDPKSAEAWTGMGWCLRRRPLVKPAEGLKCFERSLKLNRRSADAWAGKGWCLRDLGNSLEAIKAFDMTLKLNPKSTDALAGKGWALLESGKSKEALKYFDMTLAINPHYSDAIEGKKRVLGGS